MSESLHFTATEFNQQLSDHKLTGSRCTSCGAVYVPPRPICPQCPEAAMEHLTLSGAGKLAAFTVVHITPTMMLAAGYGRKQPYCTGIVKLVEGPRVSAQILGVDVQNPASIAVGTPLQATFVARGEGETQKTYLAFEPVE